MVIEFAEILQDLELKRAAALPELPTRSRCRSCDAPAVRVLGEDGGESALTAALPAGMVADALAVLAAAGGEEADTVAARAIVRAITADVLARLEGAATVTVHDVTTLVEAALIAAGYFDVAKALVLRRALPTHVVAGDGAADPPQRRGRGRGSEDKIEVAIRKAFVSLGLESAPAVALAARVGERAHALGTRVRADRDRAGHRPGGARARRPHARGRALHRLPRRAGAAARPRGRPGGAGRDPGLADGVEIVDRRRPARADRVRVDRARPRLDATALERELRRAIRPGIARADLQRLVVLNAKALMERDSEYSRFAGRILLTYIYEETLGWDIVRDGIGALKAAHRARVQARPAPRREDRADRPAAARVRPRRSSPRASIPPPTSTSTSSACRRSTTAT